MENSIRLDIFSIWLDVTILLELGLIFILLFSPIRYHRLTLLIAVITVGLFPPLMAFFSPEHFHKNPIVFGILYFILWVVWGAFILWKSEILAINKVFYKLTKSITPVLFQGNVTQLHDQITIIKNSYEPAEKIISHLPITLAQAMELSSAGRWNEPEFWLIMGWTASLLGQYEKALNYFRIVNDCLWRTLPRRMKAAAKWSKREKKVKPEIDAFVSAFNSYLRGFWGMARCYFQLRNSREAKNVLTHLMNYSEYGKYDGSYLEYKSYGNNFHITFKARNGFKSDADCTISEVVAFPEILGISIDEELWPLAFGCPYPPALRNAVSTSRKEAFWPLPHIIDNPKL